MVSADWDEKESETMIIDLWVSIRGFSAWLETANSKSVQKFKSVRK